MSRKNIRAILYKMFYDNEDLSLLDFLNNSSCDELLEVDMNDDTFKQYYHVEGKYFVPAVNLSYRGLYEYTLNHVVHKDDRKLYSDLMNPDGFFERLKHGSIPNFVFSQFRYKLQDGSYRYVEQCVISGKENGFEEGVFRIYIFDIENLKSRELGHMSSDKEYISLDRDKVTGLLTNQPFQMAADKLIKNTPEIRYCLIAIDIEHFKFFDEWYGRETGDFLLSKVGEVLLDSRDKYHILSGYFGQDDFFVLMPLDKKSISELYEEIRNVIVSFGFSVGFMPAFGVAPVDSNLPLVDAIDKATIASTRAKSDIRDRIFYYDKSIQSESEHEYRVLIDYMAAFKNDEITFYLQPQCRITTGKIIGAESLARWIKSDGTIIPPNDYIPILEKYGFITDLDQRLWEKVCKWLREWLNKGNKAVPISLNVSRTDIFTIDVLKFFLELTEKYKIPHNLLKIEITESAYTETSTLIGDLVKSLRKEGFQVLMDDFGSGYSSLNMLSTLEVDAIKLDGRFLNISDREKNKGIHILESVVNMAKQIGLPMIVEGVETKEQADFLEDLGCRYSQGYYFYKPMPIKQFEKLIGYKNNIDDKGLVAKLNEQFRIREFLDKNIYSDSMLNNIIGSVAIYSWHGEHVDIVRFNQQFYESVHVPEFAERLLNIEQFLIEEDRPKFFDALKETIKNKLNGYSTIVRFYRGDGTAMFFKIHLYYLGKKEGGESFYGSAVDCTELMNYKEIYKLIGMYSTDNLIFVRRINDKWAYHVLSHGLSDAFNLTPIQLEEELNNGEFANRVMNKKELAKFMKFTITKFENKEDFEKIFTVKDKDNNPVDLKLDFHYIGKYSTNYKYVMRTQIIKNDK